MEAWIKEDNLFVLLVTSGLCYFKTAYQKYQFILFFSFETVASYNYIMTYFTISRFVIFTQAELEMKEGNQSFTTLILSLPIL